MGRQTRDFRRYGIEASVFIPAFSAALYCTLSPFQKIQLSVCTVMLVTE